MTCISANKVCELALRPRSCSAVYSPDSFSDTLIVWTEPDGVDYALSFQDPDGCMELWNFILEVQSLRANSGGACPLDLLIQRSF